MGNAGHIQDPTEGEAMTNQEMAYASRQLVEQHLGVSQDRRVEPFRQPVVDGRRKITN
jgi:hypothetical protein